MSKSVRRPEVDHLFEAILVLENKEECYTFFEDVCTINELLSISQRYEVAKMLREKKKYLEKCGIFALPSWFEGQPVALMEAMEASCAVAASDVGGIPHIVQDGQNGLLIRPKDGDSLTEGLRRLLADAALCRRLGENARETVEASYSLEKSVGRLLEIYEEVLNGNRTCKTER